jgi:hypothetical protein
MVIHWSTTVNTKQIQQKTQSTWNWVSPKNGNMEGKFINPVQYPRILPIPMTRLAYALAWCCCDLGQQSTISARIPHWTGCNEICNKEMIIAATNLVTPFEFRPIGSPPKQEKMNCTALLVQGSATINTLVAIVPNTMKVFRRPHRKVQLSLKTPM